MKQLAALCLFALPVHAADVVLLRDGQSDYQIVVPDTQATPALTECLDQTARLVQTAFRANGAEVGVVARAHGMPRSRRCSSETRSLRGSRAWR